MSAIFGVLRSDGKETFWLSSMAKALQHRGSGYANFATIRAGEITLSSHGDLSHPVHKQVMNPTSLLMGVTADRPEEVQMQVEASVPQSICMTMDGRIYNADSLRAELRTHGYHFKTAADTELVLHAYLHWGVRFIEQLTGMFAIVIYDGRQQKLLMARDRFGIKPLFFYRSQSNMIWASEIKAILGVPGLKRQVFQQGLIANYYLQATPEPYTVFENIFSVRAGHYLSINITDFSIKDTEYWRPPKPSRHANYSLRDAAAELDERLREIVRSQMGTQLPVISMMSGGIDSTTLTAIAHEYDPSIACYSFGIDGTGSEFDELPQAKENAQKLGIRQIVEMLDADALATGIDAQIKHFEMPYSAFESTLFPAKILSGLGYKVMISGNGGDELFGGPDYYLQFRRLRMARIWKPFHPLIPAIGTFLPKVKNALSVATPVEYYANTRHAMRPYQIRQLMPCVTPDSFSEILNWLPVSTQSVELTEALFELEFKHSIAAHHAYRDGLSASRYGMEIRYPFLDHHLVDWIAGLPLSLRYNGVMNKPLLRKTAAKYISRSNLSMKKKGFGIPILPFWQGKNSAVYRYMAEKISALQKRDIYNNKAINRWIKDVKTEFDLAKIWLLVTTESWMQQYID